MSARNCRFFRRCFFAVDLGFGVFCCALMIPLLASQLGAQGTSPHSQLLDTGYREMYNLDFEGAHKSFQQYERALPQDPLGRCRMPRPIFFPSSTVCTSWK